MKILESRKTMKDIENSSDILSALNHFFAECYSDPELFITTMFPWGDPPLIGLHSRPFDWHLGYLREFGQEIKARNFDFENTVPTIQFSTASGHGVGKTALSAWLIHFLHHCRPNSRGIVTATKAEQVKEVTFTEVDKWHKLSPFLPLVSEVNLAVGNIYLKNNLNPDHWKVEGMTTASDRTESFSGRHCAGGTFFAIIDEASGVIPGVYEAMSGSLDKGEAHLHEFGNGTRSYGDFFDHHHSGSEGFIRRKICATKVFPGNPNHQEKIKKHGWDSNYVRVRIRGEFPYSAENQLIPYDAIDDCMKLDLRGHPLDTLIFGVDVSGTGEDKSVIFPVRGSIAAPRNHPIDVIETSDMMTLADKISDRIQYERPHYVMVDATGLGVGLVSRLLQLGYHNEVIPVVSSKAIQEGPCANWRAHMYYQLKQKIVDRQLQLPDNSRLRDELGAQTYTLRVTDDKILLDKKEKIKKNLKRSPDLADALALTQAVAVPMTQIHGRGGHRTNLVRI